MVWGEGGEKGGGREGGGGLLGFAPLHGDLVGHVLDLYRLHGLHHGCRERTSGGGGRTGSDDGRGEGINRDVGFGIFLSHALDHSDHGGLARRICTHALQSVAQAQFSVEGVEEIE